MAEKLTDSIVKALPAPASGYRITYDTDVKGFGIRVTAGGARAYILNYRTRSGRERRYTIGSFPDWKTPAARGEASDLKKLIDVGQDPAGELKTDRDAPTMADLCRRYEEEHLPKKRPSSQRNDRALIKNEILPAMRALKVAEVTYSDVDGLHRKITKRGKPYQANRVLALLSKMFNLAVKWHYRADNPVKGVDKNQEPKRKRYLKPDELSRLTAALAEHEDQAAANIFRLLLLTGARRSEVSGMRWADLDLGTGLWTKPAHLTKQKEIHELPFNAPARQLLAQLRGKADEDAVYVFPARVGDGPRVELKDDWAEICKAAKITGARIHDLRHSHASMLASAGLSLPVIGALLGHTQPATTARYAHLFSDPLREATERVGAIVSATAKHPARKRSAKVLPMRKARA